MTNQLLWDNHMHSSFSGDCKIPPLNMIKEAKNIGLSGITFTDHLDLDYADEEKDMFLLDIPNYLKEMRQIANEASSSSFQVLTGIEIGLQSQIADENLKIMNEANFDYIIGSIHLVDKKDPYYKEFWSGKNPIEMYQRYYETVLENIKLAPDFDALGHLDYIFRYCKEASTMDTYYDYSDIVDEILQELIRNEIALEVNTGSYRNGLEQPNPSPVILRRYKELGGQLITIGADAHKPEHIAAKFDILPEILLECGYSEYVVFKNRIPELYAL